MKEIESHPLSRQQGMQTRPVGVSTNQRTAGVYEEGRVRLGLLFARIAKHEIYKMPGPKNNDKPDRWRAEES
jgi:hypothetical protein